MLWFFHARAHLGSLKLNLAKGTDRRYLGSIVMELTKAVQQNINKDFRVAIMYSCSSAALGAMPHS